MISLEQVASQMADAYGREEKWYDGIAEKYAPKDGELGMRFVDDETILAEFEREPMAAVQRVEKLFGEDEGKAYQRYIDRLMRERGAGSETP